MDLLDVCSTNGSENPNGIVPRTITKASEIPSSFFIVIVFSILIIHIIITTKLGRQRVCVLVQDSGVGTLKITSTQLQDVN